MQRQKKLIIVSHCILNQNCVVKPYARNQKDFFDFIKNFMLNNYGFIQLPCPELEVLGLKRWGHVKDQLEYSNFEKKSKELLEPIINQIQDYLKNDYEISGVYGIKGSPSCGISKTCRGDWEGEAITYKSLDDINSRVKLVDEKGIFMEIFEKMLAEKNINLRFFDVDDWSE